MNAGMVLAFGVLVASFIGAVAGGSGAPPWRIALAVLASLAFVGVPIGFGWLKGYDLLRRIPSSGTSPRAQASDLLVLVATLVGGLFAGLLSLALSLILARAIAGSW